MAETTQISATQMIVTLEDNAMVESIEVNTWYCFCARDPR